MILHLRHIFLTEALTFIIHLQSDALMSADILKSANTGKERDFTRFFQKNKS